MAKADFNNNLGFDAHFVVQNALNVPALPKQCIARYQHLKEAAALYPDLNVLPATSTLKKLRRCIQIYLL